MAGHVTIRSGGRRAAPARTDNWTDRDRGRGTARNERRSTRSQSPIKSKLMALAMSSGREKDKGASGRKSEGDKSSRRDRHNSRDRSAQKGRLRMDELDGNKRTPKPRSPEHHRTDSGTKKSVSSLDKVVKKAREERTNYWDKKIIAAEEKDPDRWGHSGFKELYHRKDGTKKAAPRKRQRSRSGSHRRGISSRSGCEPRQSRPRSRSRSFSRSRSPIKRVAKSRKDFKSFSRSVSPAKPKLVANKAKQRSANNQKSNTESKRDSGRNSADKGNSTKASGNLPRKARINRRSSSFSSSGSSVSRSRSRSYTPARRSAGAGRPISKLSKRVKAKVHSDSYSSSNSSSDEDVLQLHAKEKARNSSISDSGSSSSSRSRTGVGSVLRRGSSSSTSDSLSSSESDDSDISIRAKPSQKIVTKKKPDKVPVSVAKKVSITTKGMNDRTPKPVTSTKVLPTLPTNTSLSKVGKQTDKKATGNDATTIVKSIKSSVSGPTSNTQKLKSTEKEKNSKKGTKSPSESGETESESGSSDSDSEPRMTLSERFAKLSQMSTDKREMAKPVLSVNEIDTKMRVVKDFRNPEVLSKVFVASVGDGSAGGDAGETSSNQFKPKSRTPPAIFGESRNRREMPDQSQQQFERMYRDTPVENRPLDWSDARVRFNYYKNRGCFDKRPITFDEYIKWEDWYHKYREWLEQEAYYSAQSRPSPNSGNRMPSLLKGVGGFPLGRRMDQMPVAGPPLSSRSHFENPVGTLYLQGHERVGRRIDRTAGGSLVVNIRPGGFQTRGRNRRPQ